MGGEQYVYGVFGGNRAELRRGDTVAVDRYTVSGWPLAYTIQNTQRLGKTKQQQIVNYRKI